MTLAIAHTEGTTQILDVLRERKPPFSPEAVVEEFATLIKSYRCAKVFGDGYAGEWPREQFSKRGVFYEPSEKIEVGAVSGPAPAHQFGRSRLA